MCLKSVQFRIAFLASSEIAFIRSIRQMDIRVTAQMSLAHKALSAVRALEGFVVGLM